MSLKSRGDYAPPLVDRALIPNFLDPNCDTLNPLNKERLHGARASNSRALHPPHKSEVSSNRCSIWPYTSFKLGAHALTSAQVQDVQRRSGYDRHRLQQGCLRLPARRQWFRKSHHLLTGEPLSVEVHM